VVAHAACVLVLLDLLCAARAVSTVNAARPVCVREFSFTMPYLYFPSMCPCM